MCADQREDVSEADLRRLHACQQRGNNNDEATSTDVKMMIRDASFKQPATQFQDFGSRDACQVKIVRCQPAAS